MTRKGKFIYLTTMFNIYDILFDGGGIWKLFYTINNCCVGFLFMWNFTLCNWKPTMPITSEGNVICLQIACKEEETEEKWVHSYKWNRIYSFLWKERLDWGLPRAVPVIFLLTKGEYVQTFKHMFNVNRKLNVRRRWADWWKVPNSELSRNDCVALTNFNQHWLTSCGLLVETLPPTGPQIRDK